MIRALTSDAPWSSCQVGGRANNALDPPVGNVSAARTVTATIVNQTGLTLSCDTATLDGGEWGVMAPDTVGVSQSASFKALSNGAGTEGSVAYRVGGGPTSVTISFSNPLFGSNSYSCQPSAVQYRCSIGGKQSDSDSAPTITVSAS
jgi:hypothetical protein